MPQTLDRTQAPALQPVRPRPFPAVRQATLPGGLPIYLIASGNQPVLELQWVFYGGSAHEAQPGQASMAAKMLSEGTRHHTGVAFAQKLDDHGASFSAQSGYEMTTLGFSSLSRTLGHTLPLLAEAALQPAFAERDYALLQRRTLQSLSIEEKKTTYQAHRAFMQRLYGPGHPYGQSLSAPDLERLTVDATQAFHGQHLRPEGSFIVAAGRFDEDLLFRFFESLLAGAAPAQPAPTRSLLPPQPTPGLHLVTMPDNLQSTVELGHPATPRNHPDFHQIRLAVMILGGYFGSRLMQNIREDKGYTYGIGGGWNALRRAGHLGIRTDVANEFVADTLHQVHLEMERICTDLVDDEELIRAKNYLLGRILAGQETPYQLAETLKTLLVNDLPVSDIATGIEVINHTTPQDILRICQQYLHPADMVQVVAGGYTGA